MSDDAPTESELDRFREQWRQEVARNRRPEPRTTTTRTERKRPPPQQQREVHAGPSQPRNVVDYSEQIEPKSYHDLPDKEAHMKLVNAGQDHDRDLFKEPVTALEHYERAVEKETQGQLGDSLKHYRQAFKVAKIVNLLQDTDQHSSMMLLIKHTRRSISQLNQNLQASAQLLAHLPRLKHCLKHSKICFKTLPAFVLNLHHQLLMHRPYNEAF